MKHTRIDDDMTNTIPSALLRTAQRNEREHEPRPGRCKDISLVNAYREGAEKESDKSQEQSTNRTRTNDNAGVPVVSDHAAY